MWTFPGSKNRGIGVAVETVCDLIFHRGHFVFEKHTLCVLYSCNESTLLICIVFDLCKIVIQWFGLGRILHFHDTYVYIYCINHTKLPHSVLSHTQVLNSVATQ